MVNTLISDLSRVLLFPKDKNYKGSLNELHNHLSIQQGYNLLTYFELNKALLTYYKSLGGKLNLYLFTSELIQESPDLQPYLQPVFKGIYSALSMGISKSDKQAYLKLASTISVAPKDILYIDDNDLNIEAAKKAGFYTILYKGNASLINDSQVILKS